VGEAEATEQDISEMERMAAQRAKDRANAARWNLDIAVLFFSVLAIIIILSSQGIGIEIVAPIALFGLCMGWLVGWRQGRRLYPRFYDEELVKIKQELKKTVKETVEEQVQKALRERWR